MSITSLQQLERALQECDADIRSLHARCADASPDYAVAFDDFAAAVRAGAEKYLVARPPDANDIPADEVVPEIELDADALREFVGELQAADLHLALACARGSERAWWDFDANYRRFIERVAMHLSGAGGDSEEVVDFIYTELYGTRLSAEGVRQSKFATYMGRGSLRGWLRAIVWHAVVDLHRARRDEVAIEDWSEAGGETHDRPGARGLSRAGDDAAMVEHVARERYGAAARAALDAAFASLDEHEKLLLLYYHVEGLKLREIARLVEEPRSPLRRWFQRQSKKGGAAAAEGATRGGGGRVYESTIMRWLEKVYARAQRHFTEELGSRYGFSSEEITLCVEMAGEGLVAPDDVRKHLVADAPSTGGLGKKKRE